MTSSIRVSSLVFASLLVFGAVAIREPGIDELDSELDSGLDHDVENDLGENDLGKAESLGSQEEVDVENDLGENELSKTELDPDEEVDLSSETPKPCEKGKDTVKTVEIIFIVVGEEGGPKILVKRTEKGEAMNCGGSFYMQCKCDDFHPDKDETTGACYAPTPDDLPTTYASADFDKGEANQLAYAAKKLFSKQDDPAKTIAIMENKGIKRLTLEGDGKKTFRVYPMALKSASALDKNVESNGWEKIKCSDIVDEDSEKVTEDFRALITQLNIKGC